MTILFSVLKSFLDGGAVGEEDWMPALIDGAEVEGKTTSVGRTLLEGAAVAELLSSDDRFIPVLVLKVVRPPVPEIFDDVDAESGN